MREVRCLECGATIDGIQGSDATPQIRLDPCGHYAYADVDDDGFKIIRQGQP